MLPFVFSLTGNVCHLLVSLGKNCHRLGGLQQEKPIVSQFGEEVKRSRSVVPDSL